MANMRIAHESDADEIAAIYRPWVERTAVSFELEPPAAATCHSASRRWVRTRPGWSAPGRTVSGDTPTLPSTATGPRTSGRWTSQSTCARTGEAAASGAPCTSPCSPCSGCRASSPRTPASRSPTPRAWPCTRPWIPPDRDLSGRGLQAGRLARRGLVAMQAARSARESGAAHSRGGGATAAGMGSGLRAGLPFLR